MKWWSGKRIMISKERDFGVLLGALIRELPYVFEAEVLTKLSVKDHLTLAQVNKECRDVVYSLEPLEFMRTCLDSYDEAWCKEQSGYYNLQASRILRYKEAVATGRLDVLKWLLDHGEVIPLRLSVGYVAGVHGQKEVIEWSSEIPSRVQYPGNTQKEATRGAATGGHLELLKYLREKGYEWDESTCAYAASEGHVHVLEYLRTNGCPWSSHLCLHFAAAGNHLDTLKWLREHGCPWDSNLTAVAAENGHFEMLKWLHEHGCPWDEDTLSSAVVNGRLDMIKWLRENGCPWNEAATAVAAGCGQLETLIWLHENGCPMSANACSEAVENESLECLKYLVDKKCPDWEDYVSIIPEWVKQKQRG
jgi:hypothetical protein